MSRTAVGTVYLLHFDRPYRHARHYQGWAGDLDARLASHAAGHGARLLQVINAAGIGWTLARTWPGGRTLERALKRQGGASRRCPPCGVQPRRLATCPEPPHPGRPMGGRRMTAHTTDTAVTVDGREYRLWDGRVRLDWHAKPVSHHLAGCRLCCTLRVAKTPGSLPRHPGNCPRCGPGYLGPRPDLCRLCGVTAHLRDDDGHPVHKTCLEHALTREALTPTRRDAA